MYGQFSHMYKHLNYFCINIRTISLNSWSTIYEHLSQMYEHLNHMYKGLNHNIWTFEQPTNLVKSITHVLQSTFICVNSGNMRRQAWQRLLVEWEVAICFVMAMDLLWFAISIHVHWSYSPKRHCSKNKIGFHTHLLSQCQDKGVGLQYHNIQDHPMFPTSHQTHFDQLLSRKKNIHYNRHKTKYFNKIQLKLLKFWRYKN